MAVIEIEHLSKTFRGKKWTSVKALSDLSLQVEEGEVFGFLGPNGAGKSTTIKLVMGLIRPTSGSARILGLEAGDYRSRQYVGYLPENPAFYDYLTGEEYLRLVGRLYRMAPVALSSAIEANLRRLELWEARCRPIRSYSKGMVQRLGLAQALLHDPQVYILDEPMSGLDPLGRALVKEIIRELKKAGKSVFFSTHITSDVEEVCDRVGIVCGGVLQSMEAVEDVRRQGVSGYRICFQSPERTEQETSVAASELSQVMRELEASGCQVILVEPQRKSLEAFFLDVVHRRLSRD